MLLEYIYNKFEYVVACDAEFTGDMLDSGELNDVVCFVYKDIKSGKKVITHGKDLKKLPFPKNDTLFIAHNAGAEVHSWLSLKIGQPKFIWDTMIEDKKLNFGKVRGHGLLKLANRYEIPGVISEELKQYYIDLILSRKYTDDDFEKILNYCLSDVLTLEKIFRKQLLDIEANNLTKGPKELVYQALFAGWAMSATAQIEFNGIPVNNKLLSKIKTHYPKIRETIINELNNKIDVYDENYTLKQNKFQEFIKRIGLYKVWPKTKTGQLSTEEKVIYRFAQEHDDVNDFYFVREFVDSQKLPGFVVGPDGRARTPYHMYGLKTGRTNQSTSRHPFNCPKPMRNIIQADPKKILVYFDYKFQEVCIAAYLSRDPLLMAAVESDPYVKTAKLTGAVPDDATKDTHPKQRKIYKTALLAVLYGQGIINMSANLLLSEDEGTNLHADLKNTYKDYFSWIKKYVTKSIIRGYMIARMGFRYWIKPGANFNPRSIYNYPIQCNGSEMLRYAIIKICRSGIECNAMIHDGLLVHLPRKKFRQQFIKVKKIMEEASRVILNKDKTTKYQCRLDWQCIRYAMIQDLPEQAKWNRILDMVDKYTRGKNPQVTVRRKLINITSGKLPHVPEGKVITRSI